MKVALDMSILTALSKEILQAKRRHSTGKAPSRRHRVLKDAILRCFWLRCWHPPPESQTCKISICLDKKYEKFTEDRKWWRQTGSRQSPPYRRNGPDTEKFIIGPGSYTDLQNPAEFSPKGKPIRNLSIDFTLSIRTRLRTPFLRTPCPRLLEELGRTESSVHAAH